MITKIAYYIILGLILLNVQFGIAQTDDQDFSFSITLPANIAGTYPWRGTTDFGGTIDESFCGEIVWAEDIEELGCEPLNSDLTDKIAIVRRGDCFFSLKIYNAQAAGAKAVIVLNHNLDSELGLDGMTGMAGVDSAAAVTIPGIFVSYNTGAFITSALEQGIVQACFELPTIALAFGPYAYYTPLSQVVPMDNISVRVINRSSTLAEDVEVALQITTPGGTVDEIKSVSNVGANDDVDFLFEGYLPTEIGEYTMKFISGLDGNEIERKFEITEYTWGMDNGNIDRSIEPTFEAFEAAGFFYQHGHLVLAGADAFTTHISFGLGNGAEMFSGDPSADLILFAIYDADKNGDNEVDDFNVFSDLGDPLEIGIYEIKGNEVFENLIYAPFENPVMLKEGGIYYVSMAYDGVDAGLGQAPSYSATASVPYLNFPSTPIQLDRLYSGYSGSTLVTRLHLEGFLTSVEDLIPLSADEFRIITNPVFDHVIRYEITLESPSDRIDVMLRDVNGRLIQQETYKKQAYLKDDMMVKGIPAGTYFLNVITDKGIRSETVIISGK